MHQWKPTIYSLAGGISASLKIPFVYSFGLYHIWTLLFWGRLERGGPASTGGFGASEGMMVNIVDESQRRGTYTVETDQGRLELESWRLETSEDSETVKAFFEEHQIYKDLYVVSEKQALPMREEPDKDTKLVYRIAKDQKLKVIRKMPGPVQVDRFEGYWYEVLSDDGVRGFAFDVYLVEFDAGTGALLVDENALQDEYAFLYERWRPEYFEEQINRGIY
jgi:hypothetical protein